MIEAGRVILQKIEFGLKIFTDECEEFTNGEFDDIVDSMLQFLLNVKAVISGDYKGMVHVKRREVKSQRSKVKRNRRYRTKIF